MKTVCKIGIRVFLVVMLVQCYPEPEMFVDHPSATLSPKDVVFAQLIALQNNNRPHLNAGIKTVYNFASPYHRSEYGPFQKYKARYTSRRYETLIENQSFQIHEHYSTENKAEYYVFVTDRIGKKWVFIFTLSKQNEAPYKDCWMTDAIQAHADPRAFTGDFLTV